MQNKITSRFAELLKRPELLVMWGGFSPLHALMSEVFGYEAFSCPAPRWRRMSTVIPTSVCSV